MHTTLSLLDTTCLIWNEPTWPWFFLTPNWLLKHYNVKFQTWDQKKCWGTYLIYQSWTWLPLPPSILQLYLLQGKAGIPYPLPWTHQLKCWTHQFKGWAAHPPEVLSYKVQTLWFPGPFVGLVSWLVYMVPLTSLSFALPHPSMTQLSLVMFNLNSSGCPCLWLCYLFYLQ